MVLYALVPLPLIKQGMSQDDKARWAYLGTIAGSYGANRAALHWTKGSLQKALQDPAASLSSTGSPLLQRLYQAAGVTKPVDVIWGPPGSAGGAHHLSRRVRLPTPTPAAIALHELFHIRDMDRGNRLTRTLRTLPVVRFPFLNVSAKMLLTGASAGYLLNKDNPGFLGGTVIPAIAPALGAIQIADEANVLRRTNKALGQIAQEQGWSSDVLRRQKRLGRAAFATYLASLPLYLSPLVIRALKRRPEPSPDPSSALPHTL
jgi:hypothetical protein